MTAFSKRIKDEYRVDGRFQNSRRFAGVLLTFSKRIISCGHFGSLSPTSAFKYKLKAYLYTICYSMQLSNTQVAAKKQRRSRQTKYLAYNIKRTSFPAFLG